jgi:hypothetical protein
MTPATSELHVNSCHFAQKKDCNRPFCSDTFHCPRAKPRRHTKRKCFRPNFCRPLCCRPVCDSHSVQAALGLLKSAWPAGAVCASALGLPQPGQLARTILKSSETRAEKSHGEQQERHPSVSNGREGGEGKWKVPVADGFALAPAAFQRTLISSLASRARSRRGSRWQCPGHWP